MLTVIQLSPREGDLGAITMQGPLHKDLIHSPNSGRLYRVRIARHRVLYTVSLFSSSQHSAGEEAVPCAVESPAQPHSHETVRPVSTAQGPDLTPCLAASLSCQVITPQHFEAEETEVLMFHHGLHVTEFWRGTAGL